MEKNRHVLPPYGDECTFSHLLQLFNTSPGEYFPCGDGSHVVEKRTRRGGGGPVSDDGCSVSRVVLNFYRQRTDKFKSLAFTFEYNGSCTKPNFVGVSLPNMTENCGGIRITRRLGFHLFADSQPVE